MKKQEKDSRYLIKDTDKHDYSDEIRQTLYDLEHIDVNDIEKSKKEDAVDAAKLKSFFFGMIAGVSIGFVSSYIIHQLNRGWWNIVL